MLAKIPDWLTARWNWKFPSFSQFVKFLTREAKIACNPVTSLQSLKQSETEKSKQPKQQKHNKLQVPMNRLPKHVCSARRIVIPCMYAKGSWRKKSQTESSLCKPKSYVSVVLKQANSPRTAAVGSLWHVEETQPHLSARRKR